MKKFVFIFLIMLLPVNPAVSSGFPTVDIAALVQRVLSYIAELEDYATTLNMYANQVQSLQQQFEAFNQQLMEYEHAIRRMRSIKQRLEDRDVLQAIKEIKRFHGDNPFYGNHLNERDPRFANAMRGANLLYGNRSSSDDIYQMINSGKYDKRTKKALQERWEEIYANDMLGVNQVANAETNAIALAELTELRSQAREQANSLGDDSELATLQLSVEQNQILMQFQEQLLLTQNQLLVENNRLTNQINRNIAREFEWRQQQQPEMVKVNSLSNYEHFYNF